MNYAIITAVLFAFSAICNTRVSRGMDQITANLIRLAIATLILGIITFIHYPQSFHAQAMPVLGLSGLIGFGVGDIALFFALSKIGSRLTILINFCTATIIGAFADTFFLGESLKSETWLFIFFILTGLTLALFPFGNGSEKNSERKLGIISAFVAGLGQGLGATTSRIADEIAIKDDIVITGISQAFQRVCAGMLFLSLIYLIKKKFIKPQNQIQNHKLAPWLILAALFGPVLGVACFQEALRKMSSGETMAIVSTSPLILIPLAYIFEGDIPSKKSIFASLLAISGVIGISLNL